MPRLRPGSKVTGGRVDLTDVVSARQGLGGHSERRSKPSSSELQLRDHHAAGRVTPHFASDALHADRRRGRQRRRPRSGDLRDDLDAHHRRLIAAPLGGATQRAYAACLRGKGPDSVDDGPVLLNEHAGRESLNVVARLDLDAPLNDDLAKIDRVGMHSMHGHA